MKYKFEFTVNLKPLDTATGDARIVSPALLAMLRQWYDDPSTDATMFTIHVSQEDAVALSLFAAIEADGGKRPVANLPYAFAHPDTHYPVRVDRILEPGDLEGSTWLYLTVPPLAIAEDERIEPDGSYVLKKVYKEKKSSFGRTRTDGWMMLFTENLKNAFLEESLTSLEFRPVKLVNGKASGLWQMWSASSMPPLSMKLLTSRHEPFEGDPLKGCIIGEGYYTWPVLRYRQRDMKKFPNVDMALTSEWFGPGGPYKKRFYVVSQRFRQVAERLAPGQFSYGMVAVGEGEELENRYRIPELDPPKD